VGSWQWAVGSWQLNTKAKTLPIPGKKEISPSIWNSLNIPKQDKIIPLSEIYLSCPFAISEIHVFHKYKTGERKRSPQVTLLI